MLVEFFTWWRQQLLDLAPESLRQGSGPAANALVADATTPGVLALRRRRRGAETLVAEIRLDEPSVPSLRAALNGRPGGEPIILRLPPHMLLERAVSLPLVAERDLEGVFTYELERLTPFTNDEVYWGFIVQARDRTRARLLVRLSLVPRPAAQPYIDTLVDCAGRPSQIEAETDTGLRTIRLAHTQTAGRIARLTQRTAAAVLAGLAFLVAAGPFLHQSLELADAENQIDALAPRMHEVDALRRRIADAGAGGDAVARENRRLGDMLEALAAITEILPDDSYLTEFTMRERKMTLSGQSASAPRLISTLSADPRMRKPGFTAPVTRADSSHNDVFSISVEWAN